MRKARDMAKGGKNGNGDSSDGGDSIRGNKRDNDLHGGPGDDVIDGRDGNDVLWGHDGDDLLIGADGDDTLHGGAGQDRLHGGDGDDILDGGADADWLQGGSGADQMDGGEGWDTASFEEIWPALDDSGVTITTAYDGTHSTYTVISAANGDTDTVQNVERIIGSNYDDTMIGGAGDDHFVGARGADAIDGGAGDDVIYGSLDDDTLSGGTGEDTFVFLLYHDFYGEPAGDGMDVVTDFDPSADTILFLASAEVTPTITYTAAGAEITYGADDSMILLENVAAGSLSAGNFDWELVAV